MRRFYTLARADTRQRQGRSKKEEEKRTKAAECANHTPQTRVHTHTRTRVHVDTRAYTISAKRRSRSEKRVREETVAHAHTHTGETRTSAKGNDAVRGSGPGRRLVQEAPTYEEVYHRTHAPVGEALSLTRTRTHSQRSGVGGAGMNFTGNSPRTKRTRDRASWGWDGR